MDNLSLEQGDNVNGYSIERLIISTNFSSVYKASSPSGVFALKFINLTNTNPQKIENEINILESCHNENIVQLTETFDYQNFKCIVTPYAEFGDLSYFIQQYSSNLTEKDYKSIVIDALNAVNYIHQLHVIHRDIKIQNFLVYPDNNNQDIHNITVKLTDFGLSKFYHPGDIFTDFPGTFQCSAPEVIKNTNYDNSADMWGLGVLFFTLINGSNPFPTFPNETMERYILNAIYYYPEKKFKKVSRDARTLIDHLIIVDPQQRYSASEALHSAWIECIN